MRHRLWLRFWAITASLCFGFSNSTKGEETLRDSIRGAFELNKAEAIALLEKSFPESASVSLKDFSVTNYWKGESVEVAYGQDTQGNLVVVVSRSDGFKSNFRTLVDHYLDDQEFQVKSLEDLENWKALRERLVRPVLAAAKREMKFEAWVAKSTTGIEKISVSGLERLVVGAEPVFVRFTKPSLEKTSVIDKTKNPSLN